MITCEGEQDLRNDLLINWMRIPIEDNHQRELCLLQSSSGVGNCDSYIICTEMCDCPSFGICSQWICVIMI